LQHQPSLGAHAQRQTRSTSNALVDAAVGVHVIVTEIRVPDGVIFGQRVGHPVQGLHPLLLPALLRRGGAEDKAAHRHGGRDAETARACYQCKLQECLALAISAPLPPSTGRAAPRQGPGQCVCARAGGGMRFRRARPRRAAGCSKYTAQPASSLVPTHVRLTRSAPLPATPARAWCRQSISK